MYAENTKLKAEATADSIAFANLYTAYKYQGIALEKAEAVQKEDQVIIDNLNGIVQEKDKIIKKEKLKTKKTQIGAIIIIALIVLL